MNDELKAKLDSIDRRQFLKNSSFASMMMMLTGGATTAVAQTAAESNPEAAANPVPCGVIGCGEQGREIVSTLARLPNAPVVAICDHYGGWLRRTGRSAPNAEKYEDYRDLLANPDVQAVIIATPTHQHREIAIAALEAGKHVYLEAPIATTVADARAIAVAAKKNRKSYFQAGLQLRSEPQRHFLVDFIRAGAMGTPLKVRAQWHRKESMRRVAPTNERQRELEWRLRHESSAGLISELGIHQIDAVNWFLGRRPKAVTGYGSIMQWKDGREVADTLEAIFDYGDGLRMNYEVNIGNSFNGELEMYYGSDCAIMYRDNKSWMFKEADAPLLGWEVYARKDKFYTESGVFLVANATKLTAQSDSATDSNSVNLFTPLYYALEAFITNTYNHNSAVEDFSAFFDVSDTEALDEYLKDVEEGMLPAAGIQMAYEATVLNIKANEAVKGGTRVELPDELFAIS